MVLMTFASLPIVSPLKVTPSRLAPEQQTQIIRAGVGLGEISDRALLHLRGNGIETALETGEMPIGTVRTIDDGLLIRLRRDEFVLFTAVGESVFSDLNQKLGEQTITVTDITHGRCGMLLVGARAVDVLPKVCGLDFADRQFPNWRAAQTSLAKVRTLIVRVDVGNTPAYGLFVDRSLAAYVWGVVVDAAQEFDAIVCSKEGFDFLRKASVSTTPA
jgi:heterotetrameric sarcosine oxidase gamma subunit